MNCPATNKTCSNSTTHSTRRLPQRPPRALEWKSTTRIEVIYSLVKRLALLYLDSSQIYCLPASNRQIIVPVRSARKHKLSFQLRLQIQSLKVVESKLKCQSGIPRRLPPSVTLQITMRRLCAKVQMEGQQLDALFSAQQALIRFLWETCSLMVSREHAKGLDSSWTLCSIHFQCHLSNSLWQHSIPTMTSNTPTILIKASLTSSPLSPRQSTLQTALSRQMNQQLASKLSSSFRLSFQCP